MIELPEAVTLARQIDAELAGKRIVSAVRGNSPHKFAFYTGSPEEYAATLTGRTIGPSVHAGACVNIAVEPDYVLELGGGGERILLHAGAATLPQKHQLLLGFGDGTWLSVSVQGWGSVKLLPGADVEAAPRRVSPLSDDFTRDHFEKLFDELKEADPRSVKYFVISQPGVRGVGNGYLQDILFRAALHPRRRAAELNACERDALYTAIRATLVEAVERRGRDTELDLHGRPGRYRPILDRRTKQLPCPRCGALIEVISFLGGRCYLCPACQV
ncbi:MAG: hypothetical protein HYU66_15945 [Armatimonadetes bacterium]|nr:hypothetical protein [Armatimonadota bacterium]